MPKKPSLFERDLETLHAIAAGDDTRPIDTLRRILGGASGFLIAEAARVVSSRSFTDLHPDLVRAFERLLRTGAKEDAGCNAKKSIALALSESDEWHAEVFLKGARYVQRERSGTTMIDTAGGLRGISLHALFRCRHPDAVFVATELLADPEAAVRAESARALGHFAAHVAEPLLRFKLLSGDEDPDVISACAAALIVANAERSAPFLYERLKASTGQDAASLTLAIGEGRPPGALDALTEQELRAEDEDARGIVYLAIALLRDQASLDFLLARLAKEGAVRGPLVIDALAIHRHDPRVVEAVEAVLKRRGSAELGAAWRERVTPG